MKTNRTPIVLALLATLFLTLPLAAQTVEAFIAQAPHPQDVAVNPVTNKISVMNEPTSQFTEIDGATNAPTAIALPPNPETSLFAKIAINPITNKIYGVNAAANTVAVLDGATHATTFVTTGSNP